MTALTKEQLDAWPNCISVDCGYKRNLWLGSGYCYKCHVVAFDMDESDIAAVYESTHPGEKWESSK